MLIFIIISFIVRILHSLMIICSLALGRTSKVTVNSLFIWAPSVGACAFLLPVYFSFHLVICFSDALMSGILNEVAVLEDPSLHVFGT